MRRNIGRAGRWKRKQSKAVPLHATEVLRGERRYSFYSFLTSALDGGEWSVSRPGRALPRGKDPRYPLYRTEGGPQSRSGHRGYRKILCPCRGSNPDRTVIQSVVRHYTDWATPAPERGSRLEKLRETLAWYMHVCLKLDSNKEFQWSNYGFRIYKMNSFL
jgi:hypothetical protein